VLFAAREADACSCAVPDDARDYLPGANVAFEGVVDRVEQRGARLENVFQVSRVWKGDVGSEISIDTAGGVCSGAGTFDSCGIVLTPGERYLVFAGFQWSTCMATADLCSGTRLASEAEDAFEQLGPGTPPADGGTAQPAPCNETPCPDAGPPATGGSGGAVSFDAMPAGGSTPVDAGDPGEPEGSGPALQPVRDSESGGCACSTPSASGRGRGATLLLLLAAALGALRRRR
jgi:MYXO-CTERM domain-containing protein